MQAKKLEAEVTELDFDPASVDSDSESASAKTIRVIIVGKGGTCKKYTASDGSVVWVCG